MIAKFKGDWTKMTCSGCVRFTKNIKGAPGYHCCGVSGPDEIRPDTPACKDYWDRAEQEALEEAERLKAEKARQMAWEKNRNNPPRPARWVRGWDETRGCPTGAMPFCPNCDEPLYETDQCYFCGQKIAQDAEMEKFQEPPEEKRMDCFWCGGVNTFVYTESRYNGHRSGCCTKCGIRFIE